MRRPSPMIATNTTHLLTGDVAGIVMGIQQNFTLAPAHARFNLVRGVLLFLFGRYDKVVPAAAELPPAARSRAVSNIRIPGRPGRRTAVPHCQPIHGILGLSDSPLPDLTGSEEF